MLRVLTGREMLKKYRKQIILDADAFYLTNPREITEEDAEVAKKIDGATYVGEGMFQSKFPFGYPLDEQFLSTGCKTLINFLHYPNLIHDFTGAGENVWDIFLDMPMIAQPDVNYIIYSSYLGFRKIPSCGIYLNESEMLYMDYKKFSSAFVGVTIHEE